MKKVGQRYIWTTRLVPNVKQPNRPWLILKRIPAPDLSASPPRASELRRLPNPLPDAPSSFTPSSVSSPSSSSSCCCSSCCSSSRSSSPSCCGSSSSSPGPSPSPQTRSAAGAPLGQRGPVGEADKWTCELVEGHRKVVLRRQLSGSSAPGRETARRPGAVGPPSAPPREAKRPLRSRQPCNKAGKESASQNQSRKGRVDAGVVKQN
ncbi:uncharacterized protein LOC112450929 [Kryptolebias marmoratus]|uniref:uncharacterized protein LOC112450929 n=1 Tax=Kryptolebias marmoratus TaxID=37003 RepID=UPI000D52F8B1|nr:uncharacterized protein LOC112450929 [Kryptolebias marmoratus]